MAPLNEEQSFLNRQRQEIVAKMYPHGHAFGDVHLKTPEGPVLLRWPKGAPAVAPVEKEGKQGALAQPKVVVMEKPTFQAKAPEQELALQSAK